MCRWGFQLSQECRNGEGDDWVPTTWTGPRGMTRIWIFIQREQKKALNIGGGRAQGRG